MSNIIESIKYLNEEAIKNNRRVDMNSVAIVELYYMIEELKEEVDKILNKESLNER